MFQRIARRHTDRPDDPTATDAAVGTAGDAVPSAPTPSPDGEAPTVAGPPAPTPSPDGEAPTVAVPPAASEPGLDAPTEALTAIEATPGDAPTTLQPIVDVPPPSSSEASTPAPVTGTPPTASAAPAPADAATTLPVVASPQPAATSQRRPGFRARGRLRRRLRYLRKLRELQVRDLGGLVFDLRRFERKRDDLVAQKIDQIRACDDELRALELALDERRELRDVREPGIGGTCPRCFAVFGSADHFCASCGAALGGAVQSPAQVPAPAPSAVPPEAGGTPQ